MNISTALPIQPGSPSLLAGATSATGAARAFAALIGGGVGKAMPIRVTNDAAAGGGQAGAVIGNAVPLKAPATGPDILVDPAQSPASAIGNSSPVSAPDIAPDILVDPDAPVVAPSAAKLGDPSGVRDPSEDARFAKGSTIPGGNRTRAGTSPSGHVVSGAPITPDSLSVSESEHEAGSAASSDDATSPAVAGGAVAADPIVDPRSLVATFSPAPVWTSVETPPLPSPLSTDPAAASTADVTVTAALRPISEMLAPPGTDPSVTIPTTAPALPARADQGNDAAAALIRAAAGQGKSGVPEPKGRPSPVANGEPLTAVSSRSPVAPTPLSAGAVAPAGELFATAIHAAGRSRPDPGHEDVLPSAAMLVGAPVVATPATGADADRSLDLAHPGWPGAMIEHIERLRDAADAVDTRIRLVPDALGGIDVSLRRHDDGVHVALSADRPATQAILAEARPRLDALAETRGIRLTDATTGHGAGSLGGDPSSAHGRPRPVAFIPAAPARAAATDNPDSADSRVA